MRDVMVVVHMQVDDDVQDTQVADFLPSLAAQVEEPVCGFDASGNEIRFTASGVMLDCYVDGRVLTTLPA